jgi:hypothetical protein
MKKLTLGLAIVAALLTAAPAMAQVGVYAGRHGVGVELGTPRPYYGCGYNYPCGYYDYYGGPYDYYGGPNVVIGGGPAWHGHARWHHDR